MQAMQRQQYQYAQEVLHYFYEAAEHDFVYFGQLLGVVSYDQQDRPLAKSVRRRLEDALQLLCFLVDTQDFLLCHAAQQANGKILHQPFAGRIHDFRVRAEQIVLRYGIDDANLNTGFWLRKIQSGAPVVKVPEEIAGLFF